MPTTILRKYRGSSNFYTDVAQRGAEILGLGLSYAIHPSGFGAIVVRFVARSESKHFGEFTHFVPRAQAEFIDLTDGTPNTYTEAKAKAFYGIRLNKFAVPVLNPGPSPLQLGGVGDSFNLWEQVGDWLHTQMTVEGFTLLMTNEELIALVRAALVPEVPDVSAIQLDIKYPDLVAYRETQMGQAPVTVDEGDGDGGDEDDEDGDENGEDEDDGETVN